MPRDRLPEGTPVRFAGLDKGLVVAAFVLPVVVLGLFFEGLIGLAQSATDGIF